jgi:hypothetical protein
MMCFEARKFAVERGIYEETMRSAKLYEPAKAASHT